MLFTFADNLPPTKSSQCNRQAFTASQALPGSAGLMELTSDRDASEYVLIETATDWAGRAFIVSRIGGDEPYATFIGSRQDTRCSCAGFERWSFCRHITALLALIQAGEL